jgi:hypothetical protein
MTNRTSMFSLAAIASLATAALASTDASAAQFTVNHSGGHIKDHWHPYPICSWGCGHDHDHDRDDWRWRFGHRLYEGGGVTVASAGASAAPAAGPAPTGGGCLTKRELPDGSALFRDLCTHEQAESQGQGGAPGAR